MLAKMGWVVVGVGLDDDGRRHRRVAGCGGVGCCWIVDGVDIGGCEWEQIRLKYG